MRHPNPVPHRERAEMVPFKARRPATSVGMTSLLSMLLISTSFTALLASPAAGQTGSGAPVVSQFERSVRGESALRVEVQFGAGSLSLGVADAGLLYRARIQTHEGRTLPVHEYRDGRLRVGNESAEGAGRLRAARGETPSLDLRLSRSVPINLDLSMGAVEADLDLSGIPLRSLQVSTGASQTTLLVSRPNSIQAEQLRLDMGAASFTATGLGHLRARRIEISAGVGSYTLGFEGLQAGETVVAASVGIGSLEVRVPPGVAVEVQRSGVLLSVQAPSLERQGNRWVSPNWDTAATRLSLQVDGAIGTLRVTTLRP